MKSLRVWSLCWMVVFSFSAVSRGDVKLPNIFGDHMVMQASAKLPVWGTAAPGEEVTVTLGSDKQATKADDKGNWRVTLGEVKPSGPALELTVTGKNTIKLTDILVGEVWVCSGQSNMEWSVAASNNPQEEIKAADFPQIRLFTVQKKIAQTPQTDCTGKWQVCSPQSIPGFTAVGYFFGRHLHKELKVPVGLVNTSWGGTICEAWTSHGALESDSDFKPILDRAANFDPKSPNQASVLYNGMIQPIVPLAIRGAIWYQGESNRERAEQYAKLFPTMISDWRKQWNQGDFPFLFVELAPYRYDGKNPDAVAMAELQFAQTQTLSLKNTGYAVTTDIGNVADIHPKNKQEVGKRLAVWALANTYGQKLSEYTGPMFDQLILEGNKAKVKFKHVGSGLVSRDGKPLTHFEVAGDDNKYVPAKAEIDGDSVIVSADSCPKPAHVRFAWRDIAEPNLANKDGFPANLFKTDKLPLTTAGKK